MFAFVNGVLDAVAPHGEKAVLLAVLGDGGEGLDPSLDEFEPVGNGYLGGGHARPF